MRNFILGVVCTLLVLAVVGFGIANFGMMPTHANATPPLWETHLAATALDASMDRRAPRINNPLPPTDDNLEEGMRIYTMNCSVCHGTLDNKPSPLAHSLYPPPPQIVLQPLDDPEWHIYYATRTGVRYSGMPAWSPTLSDEEIWKVTAFLARIPKLPPSVQDFWRKSFGVGPPTASESHDHD